MHIYVLYIDIYIDPARRSVRGGCRPGRPNSGDPIRRYIGISMDAMIYMISIRMVDLSYILVSFSWYSIPTYLLRSS